MQRHKRLKKHKRLQVVKTNYQSKFDTQGSYTGIDLDDKYEKPIQDADDL